MDFNEIKAELGEFSALGKKPLDRMILAALVDLCRKTWVYTEKLTILTTAGTCRYALSPSDSDTEICGLSAAEKGTINVPQPSAATAATGGTLGADTYSYKVTAINTNKGETLPCVAVTQLTSGSTSTVTLTWSAISGASGYRIYGRGDTDWKLLKEVTAVTWTDDGSESQGTDEPPTESFLMEDIDIANTIEQARVNRVWRVYESDNITALIYDGKTSVELNRVPVTAGISFQAKVALYPTAEIAIPTILEPYKDDIINYVMWKVHYYPKTSKTPWVDGQKAMTYRKEYRTARANLKAKVMEGFGGKQEMSIPFFC